MRRVLLLGATGFLVLLPWLNGGEAEEVSPVAAREGAQIPPDAAPPGAEGTQGSSSVPSPEEARAQRGEPAGTPAGAAASGEAQAGKDKGAGNDLPIRDPFQSFLPYDVSQRLAAPQPEPGPEEGGPAKEDVLDLTQFNVAGLVWGIEQARAIINNQIVGVGDTIGEAQVLRIDRDGILFGYHEREFLLKRNL